METMEEISSLPIKPKRNRKTTRRRVKARVASLKFIRRKYTLDFESRNKSGWYVRIPGKNTIFVPDFPTKGSTNLQIMSLSLKKAKDIRNKICRMTPISVGMNQ